ncbi:MAG: phosphoenolpyruvate--protein phosphotransferase [Chloroflexi bacterium HGW-Chloroflexi-3]|nr:MAG: phosphoenolpyruvate--protein phosphotransferase [Chloroflexi bacterium HGW-Chloroflexi-3]
MKTLQISIDNPTGLHARPAKNFVNLAKKFKADIFVEFGEKKVNAKSLISLLTLGVKPHQVIKITCEGEGEDEALQALQKAIQDGLGDDLQALKQSAAEPLNTTVREAGLVGMAVSPGITVGKVFEYRRENLSIDMAFRSNEEETLQLENSLKQVQKNIQQSKLALTHQIKAEDLAIFDAHQEILSDQNLLDEVSHQIRQGHSAVNAWQSVLDEKIRELSAVNNSLIRDRVADLYDLRERVLREMTGRTGNNQFPSEPVIVFAQSLLPSDAIAFAQHKILGVALVEGSTTDHSAILSRALGIPAVAQLKDQLLQAERAEQVILDGNRGYVNLTPTQAELDRAQQETKKWETLKQTAQMNAAAKAQTVDGHTVEVAANIASNEDVQQAVEKGADGVGLLRTEFLFDKRKTPPTEEEQYNIYKAMLRGLDGRTLVLRTLDIGGDKPLPFINFIKENNPFLGERGIRLCLREEEIFRTQLRAALCATENGSMRIMFPMVGDYEEWQQAKTILQEIQTDLKVSAIEVGMMIEVPSAVVLADQFAREVDFFSIGTNDLTQYTLAVDRTHQRLGHYLDGLHPAVLRQIQRTVSEAHKHGKWVGICGELGADPTAIPVLVGLGVDELSVNIPAIPLVKDQIRKLNFDACQQLADQVLECRTAKEVRARVHEWQQNLSSIL